jgi:hypothetical protein
MVWGVFWVLKTPVKSDFGVFWVLKTPVKSDFGVFWVPGVRIQK